MNKNIIIIVTIILLVVIIGFFLLPIPRISLYYIGLLALIIAIMASSISIISIDRRENNKNIILYNTSLATSTLFYIMEVIISLLFINQFKGHISTFVFLQLFINSVYLIFLIAINMSAKKLYQSETSTYIKKEEGQNKKPKRGGF